MQKPQDSLNDDQLSMTNPKRSPGRPPASKTFVLSRSDQPVVYLTRREAECAFYCLQGRTMREIGMEIHLSPRTVEFYFRTLKEKLGCRTRSELVRYLLKTDFYKRLGQNLFVDSFEAVKSHLQL